MSGTTTSSAFGRVGPQRPENLGGSEVARVACSRFVQCKKYSVQILRSLPYVWVAGERRRGWCVVTAGAMRKLCFREARGQADSPHGETALSHELCDPILPSTSSKKCESLVEGGSGCLRTPCEGPPLYSMDSNAEQAPNMVGMPQAHMPRTPRRRQPDLLPRSPPTTGVVFFLTPESVSAAGPGSSENPF